MERAVVLAAGQPLTPELLAPPGRHDRRWRPLRSQGDLAGLVSQLVRLGIQTLPDTTLYDRIVGSVERELIEQVLTECDRVQVKAAHRLGINRNTLHKKVGDFEKLDGAKDQLTSEE